MRILAIDSSGLVATVAVVEEENEISKTIAEYTINYKKTLHQLLVIRQQRNWLITNVLPIVIIIHRWLPGYSDRSGILPICTILRW